MKIKINKIEKIQYEGYVYNLEIEPNHETKDDQFYLDADTGIVVHNCHPRDNIALRWLSNELDLGYDLFHAIMHSRDIQAKNLAIKLEELSSRYRLPVVIHGRAYKPNVEYTIGSYSELIGFYLKEKEVALSYVDPLTGDNNHPTSPAVFLMAHDPTVTYAGTGLENEYEYKFYCEIPNGSIILDPWRKIPKMENVKVIHYGNPRFKG